ncbi:MAG: transposase [Candidatus Nitrosopolaris sp.]
MAIDSTGLTVANRGEWIRHKWNVRRRYLKIHVAVDIKNKKIISLEVTSEEVRDGKVLNKLIDNASENNKVRSVLADGMYDSNKNFRYLSKNHIKPGIKTRSNSKVNKQVSKSRSSSLTSSSVLIPLSLKSAFLPERCTYVAAILESPTHPRYSFIWASVRHWQDLMPLHVGIKWD